MKYAMLAIKAQLAAILRTFRVSTKISMDDIKLVLWIIFRSEGGFPVKLQPRLVRNG